jgi:superfamily II DNA or RNA helicase
MEITVDEYIASHDSWDSLWRDLRSKSSAKQISTTAQGHIFERLTQLYIQNEPSFKARFCNVWWHNKDEVPPDVVELLSLPPSDEGIDLIAKTNDGKYVSVQSKFRARPDRAHRMKDINGFLRLSFETCKNIESGMFFNTTIRPTKKLREASDRIIELGLSAWEGIDKEKSWRTIIGDCNKAQEIRDPHIKREHQKDAIKAAAKHFTRKERGRMVMPCGTGKSLTAYWIAERLKARSIIVAVPSLFLIKQSRDDWLQEYDAGQKKIDWLCVCSDDTAKSAHKINTYDSFVGSVYEVGDVTTKEKEIASFLQKKGGKIKVIFTTYHSGGKLANVARRLKFDFDFAVFDEAHRTVGAKDKDFAILLDEEKISIRKRMFMTATERVIRGQKEMLISMDDEERYGQLFYQLSFKEAIREHLISDYKIISMLVTRRQVENLIRSNRILNINPSKPDVGASNLAAGICLMKTAKKYKLRRMISFHSSIKRAEGFAVQQDILKGEKIGLKTFNASISSKLSANARITRLREFERHTRTLLSNSRCLSEGINIPSIDCVLFADPKESEVDIVQAVGRALRYQEGKIAYVIIPIVVPDTDDFETYAKSTAFRKVARVVAALSVQDERIVEEMRMIEDGGRPKNPIFTVVNHDPKAFVGMKMSAAAFGKAISGKIWEKVARADWLPYDKARDWVHTLCLERTSDWNDYVGGRLNGLPPLRFDIPNSPEAVYRHTGWRTWGEWLGNDTHSWKDYPFADYDESRRFVRRLNLASVAEWRRYCRGDIETAVAKPYWLPVNPQRYYARKGTWVGWNDWLGTDTIATRERQYRSYDDACDFVHSLGLHSQNDWNNYCRGEKINLLPRPVDIPVASYDHYSDQGTWRGWPDFLGYKRRSVQGIKMPFEEARAFSRGLNLTKKRDWDRYIRGELKDKPPRPAGIPSDPYQDYTEFVNWGDWLGLRVIEYWPYNKSARFIRKLKLGSVKAYREYCAGRLPNLPKKPVEIPNSADSYYKKTGEWPENTWRDYLGSEEVAVRSVARTTFREGRNFARKLGLKSGTEWKKYCQGGFKNLPPLPSGVPEAPWIVYENAGWESLPDWLGYEKVGAAREFRDARAYARSLGLKSQKEWQRFASSGSRPNDIPSSPGRSYKGKGWKGYRDWLGKD